MNVDTEFINNEGKSELSYFINSITAIDDYRLTNIIYKDNLDHRFDQFALLKTNFGDDHRSVFRAGFHERRVSLFYNNPINLFYGFQKTQMFLKKHCI